MIVVVIRRRVISIGMRFPNVVLSILRSDYSLQVIRNNDHANHLDLQVINNGFQVLENCQLVAIAGLELKVPVDDQICVNRSNFVDKSNVYRASAARVFNRANPCCPALSNSL